MAVAHEHHLRRDDGSAFNSREFYLLQNFNMPSSSLSAGTFVNTNGEVKFSEAMKLSSENWQLFFQSGRYFIRNWDYGANWQLGLTEDSRLIPRLYPRSGSLGQQWTLNKVEGGWEMVNELWGAGTTFALPRGWPMAAMRSEADGAVWNITNNPSAAVAKPITGEMLSKVQGFQAVSSAPSSTPTTSTTSIAPSAISATHTFDVTGSPLSGGSTPTTSLTFATGSSSLASSSPTSLSGGAIGGIVAGAVVLVSAIVFALWFFVIKKRNARKRNGNPYEMPGHGVVAEKYAHYHGAELSAPPAELACREKDTILYRTELESPSTESHSARRAR